MIDPIKVLIVDDELHARRGLRELLSRQPDMLVVGEATNGDEAIRAIRRLRPELVFLDVEMPKVDGLGVVEAIGPGSKPYLVFVTAYDRYAVAAFEADAIDYLLKPFTDDRFEATLERARRALRNPVGDTGGSDLIERFTVKVGGALEVHRVDEIDWIEADEYYVKIHIGDRSHMVRQTMGSLEASLPADRFARIHRSTIVNLDRIAALEPMFQGDYTVVLSDGTRLRMSRRRREALTGIMRGLT